MGRLERQIEFITEIDKLKSVYRQTYLIDASRKENDSEHSWHLAVMACILSEYSKDVNVDVSKTIKMVLVHDLVEIDAGDTYAYDAPGHEDKEERERKAAERLFGILPQDQGMELKSLWEEFEERRTPEAKLAAALDIFQPLLHNYKTCGKSWQYHKVTSDKVMKRIIPLEESVPELWRYAVGLVEESVEKGYLNK